MHWNQEMQIIQYPDEVKYILKTSLAAEYEKLASNINKDNHIKIVLIQHEFGFFKEQEQAFLQFLYELIKTGCYCFSYSTASS